MEGEPAGPSVKVVAAVILVAVFAVAFLMYSQSGRPSDEAILDSLRPKYSADNPRQTVEEWQRDAEALKPQYSSSSDATPQSVEDWQKEAEALKPKL